MEPVKVKLPSHIWTLLLALTIAPAEALMVVPAPMVKVPVPSAVVLLMASVPPARVSPPAPEFVGPLRVSAPAPLLVTALVKVTLPEIASDEVPVPLTVHVCGAPTMTGAPMVTAPPPEATKMPLVAVTGASVSLLATPPTPESMETVASPAGWLLN